MNLQEQAKQFSPRMLVVITKLEDGARLEKFFDASNVPILYQCRGKGTAPSELMDIFGLSGTTRLVTATFLPRKMAKRLFEGLESRLEFRQKGGGVAVSIPVTGLQSHILDLLKDDVRDKMEKRMEERMREDMSETEKGMEYVVIWASVSTGYSDDVLDAARGAGAQGGTVLKGRRRNSEHVSQYLGVLQREEQEYVMIIAPRSKKRDIMAAISRACGPNTEAHGVVLSLPVDDSIGLEI